MDHSCLDRSHQFQFWPSDKFLSKLNLTKHVHFNLSHPVLQSATRFKPSNTSPFSMQTFPFTTFKPWHQFLNPVTMHPSLPYQMGAQLAQSPPSTYYITMHKCFRLSKLKIWWQSICKIFFLDHDLPAVHGDHKAQRDCQWRTWCLSQQIIARPKAEKCDECEKHFNKKENARSIWSNTSS